MTEGEMSSRLFAVVVCANRYGRNVIVELSEPPADWRCQSHMMLACFSSNRGLNGRDPGTHSCELIPIDEAATAWFDLTGVPLNLAIK